MPKRRIVTAREQHEMLSPWRRTAAPDGVPDDGSSPPLKWEPSGFWNTDDNGEFRMYPNGTFAAKGHNGAWDPPNAWKGEYTILPPNFYQGETDFPHWRLIHRYGPEGKYRTKEVVTTHPSREHAEMAAQYHHQTGTPTTEFAERHYHPGEEEAEWDEGQKAKQPTWTPEGEHVKPGPHRLSIERHLVDEDYTPFQWHTPIFKDEFHPTGRHALHRLQDVADSWGCEVEPYYGGGRFQIPDNDTTRYYRFNGPEEGEVQGYAKLDPSEGMHGDFGDHDSSWDPDEKQDPLDPRVIGANRRTANDGKLPLQWKPVPHLPELWPGREAFRAEPGNHYTYFLDSPYGDFDPANPHWSWPNMWKLNHSGPDGDGEWYNSPTSYHATRDEAIQAAAAHHVLGRDPLDHPGARRGEDYAITPEQDRAAKEYTHNLLNPPGAVDDGFEWDDEDEDGAPGGVWTPPPYHDRDHEHSNPGGMYGTPRERYLEDLYHGHLVDLDDHELIGAYEHQRTQPGFKGSDLEDTMWTAVGNRVDNEADPVVNETKLEDMLHGTTTPDSPITDYFNKVHGCDEHMWTPPDLHEPHGNFGDHPEGWDPDEGHDPFDPRIIGASRTAAMNELDWDKFTRLVGDDPEERPSAVTDAGNIYYVMPPWNHHEQPVNGFGETVESEHPERWALIHRFDPDNGFWDHAVTYHPTREHAMGAAEHHHVTGEAPSKWPGTIPHSDYDADQVESWPDIAENVDREREEEEWDDDDEDVEDHDDGKPKLSMPDISIKDRKNSLKWQKYIDGRELSYEGESTSTSQHSYGVELEHGKTPNKAHLRGKFRVFWHKPYYSSSNGQSAAPDGSFQEEHGGLNYHDTLEGALDWAEKHNQDHSWDPDRDPFDPRTFGASRREERDE